MNQFGYVGDDGNIIYIDDEEEKEEEKQEKPIAVIATDKEEEKEEEDEHMSNVLNLGQDDKQDTEIAVDASEAVVSVEQRLPLPRINPALIVRGNTIYVYGGVLEVSRLAIFIYHLGV